MIWPKVLIGNRLLAGDKWAHGKNNDWDNTQYIISHENISKHICRQNKFIGNNGHRNRCRFQPHS